MKELKLMEYKISSIIYVVVNIFSNFQYAVNHLKLIMCRK